MKRTVLKNLLALFSVALLIILLAACGGTVDEPGVDSTPPVEETPSSEETPDAVTPVPVDMEDVTEEVDEEEPSEMPQPGIPDPEAFMTEQVTLALAERLGIDAGEITVESLAAVEWPDASLGCADPDQSYAQVITPGFEITLAAGGDTYTYHTDMQGLFVLCGEDGRPVE